jgi:glutamine---fructose-6-phosphate transaminase (isomerizing)
MCGIFGVLAGRESGFSAKTFKKAVDILFTHSESRGKEASGFAIRSNGNLRVYKQPVRASELLKSHTYSTLLKNALDDSNGNGSLPTEIAVVGHCRLATNGSRLDNRNNQPVETKGIVGVHNGIIVNELELWKEFSQLHREYEVDTEILLSLIDLFRKQTGSVAEATSLAFSRIQGTASVGVLFSDMPRVLMATNNGSLYFCEESAKKVLVFASERHILEQALKDRFLRSTFPSEENIIQVKPGEGMIVDLVDFSHEAICAPLPQISFQDRSLPAAVSSDANVQLHPCQDKIDNLRRCTQCVLPETVPFISFDEEGVCNYCRSYKPMKLRTMQELKDFIDRYRTGEGNPDCVVAFSGGRDSSYGLHVVKKELGMNPVAYTYDWGMVNALARRNQARLCGVLGVEQIIVSANIPRKLHYIRQNVQAWMKKPDLGMVPLFMAGDKQFFYYANQVARQVNARLIIFSANKLEKTSFKTGFCGIPPDHAVDKPHSLSAGRKLSLGLYYMKQFGFNPAYLNSSILDTLTAFLSYYVGRQDFLMLYDFVPYPEDEIVSLLRREYDWETSPDSATTWRIGDGTVPLYNYIYYTAAGFTENDTFRSNQIREGLIRRDDALRRVREENQPRFDSIREYTQIVGVDYNKLMNAIDSMPKLY